MESTSPKACIRCGKCCLTDFIAYVADEDIERWTRERRDDILSMIQREHAVWAGNHLVSSDNGHWLRGCPFLSWEGSMHTCNIYETRPLICRHYEPGSSEICPKWDD